MGKKRIVLVCSSFLLFAISPFVSSSLISTNPGDFAVFAGGSLTTGREVNITGNLGSAGRVYLSSRTQITGSAYSGSTFSTSSNVKITGRIISKGKVSIGSQSKVGSIDTLNRIRFGNNVSTNGNISAKGWISIERNNTIYGNLASDDRIYIGRHTRITGDVKYKTAFWKDNTVQIDGSILQGTTNPDTWNWTLRTKPNFTYGSENIYVSRNNTFTLDPGDYKNIATGKKATVYLSSGTYNLYGVWFGEGTKIIADTSAGDITINTSNMLSAGKNVKLTNQNSGKITIRADKGIWIGRGSDVEGNLWSFNHLTLDKDVEVEGTLYAQNNIYLGEGTSVVVSTGADVPEPMTILLLITGAFLYRKIGK